MECFSDSLGVLSQYPYLLHGRLCEHMLQSATFSASESASMAAVLLKHSLLGTSADRWRMLEPHTLLVLAGEVARLTGNTTGAVCDAAIVLIVQTPPCTPVRRSTSFSLAEMTPDVVIPIRSISTHSADVRAPHHPLIMIGSLIVCFCGLFLALFYPLKFF